MMIHHPQLQVAGRRRVQRFLQSAEWKARNAADYLLCAAANALASHDAIDALGPARFKFAAAMVPSALTPRRVFKASLLIKPFQQQPAVLTWGCFRRRWLACRGTQFQSVVSCAGVTRTRTR
eukprot:3511663-Rhodomonas_salina.1